MISEREIIEQFHLLLLNQLGLNLPKGAFVLKGGCNLRFYFNSIRYSEDMDIDIHIVAKETLQNKMNRIVTSAPFTRILTQRQIAIQSMVIPKQTLTTQRFKFQLSTQHFQLPLATKVEFSRRGIHDETAFGPINSELTHHYQLPVFLATHYTCASAFQQKVKVLLHRAETQARDIFDLYILSNQLLSEQQQIKLSETHKKEAINNISAMEEAHFKSQVLSFLETPYQKQYASMWDTIRLHVLQLFE